MSEPILEVRHNPQDCRVDRGNCQRSGKLCVLTLRARMAFVLKQMNFLIEIRAYILCSDYAR